VQVNDLLVVIMWLLVVHGQIPKHSRYKNSMGSEVRIQYNM